MLAEFFRSDGALLNATPFCFHNRNPRTYSERINIRGFSHMQRGKGKSSHAGEALCLSGLKSGGRVKFRTGCTIGEKEI